MREKTYRILRIKNNTCLEILKIYKAKSSMSTILLKIFQNKNNFIITFK